MSDALFLLIGMRVARAKRVHDYVQHHFQDGACLSINNLFTVDGVRNGDSSFESLAGRYMMSALDFDTYVEFVFSGARTLRVGMAGDDCHGPEGLVFSSFVELRVSPALREP